MKLNGTDNQAEYFRSNPPGCFSGFVTKPTKFGGIEFDGHGFSGSLVEALSESINVLFQIECQCGGKLFTLHAKEGKNEIWQNNETVIAEEYILECNKCSSRRVFFNSSRHGYDSEVMRLEGLLKNDGDPEKDRNDRQKEERKCSCKNCNQSSFEFLTRLEYFDDLFGMDEFKGREQDLFSWFSGIGKCNNCNTLNLFIDFECS